MARVINQIVTQSTTQGFQQTGKQIDDLSKKQTRLANESTNTGRAFASQASGLGGLVAAYAGAAATTFALQQSFSALSAAARSQAMVEGVKSLAASLGQDGAKIIGSLQGITRGQLSLTEAAQNTSIALAAGLNASQIEELGDIATKASKVLGRDLTDSLQRLTRGVGKLEPELLDELGIFTRIEPAVEKYAARLGRASSSLTNFERRQAFANAVAEEGSIKYRNVDTTITDSAQNLNRLAANLIDVATKIGQTIVTIFDPLISFLNKDLSNISGLVLLLGTLIFNKLGQVTTEGIRGLNRSYDEWASNTTARFTETGKAAEKYRDAIVKLRETTENTKFTTFAGTKAQQKETRDAIKQIREGNVAVTDLPRLQKIIESQIARETKLGTGPSGDRANSLTTIVGKIGEASSAATPGVTILGKAFGTVSSAISLAGRGLGFFVTLIGRLSLFYTVLDLIGTAFSALTGYGNIFSDLISSVGKFFVNLFEGYRDARTANQAFISSFKEGDDAIKKSTSSLSVFTSAQEKAADSFSNIIRKTLKVGPPSRELELLDAARARGNPSQIADAERKLAETRQIIRNSVIRDTEQEFDTRIRLLEKQAETEKGVSRETLLTEALILKNRKTEYISFYKEISSQVEDFGLVQKNTIDELTTALTKELGVTANQAVKLFRIGITSLDKDSKVVFTSLDGNIKLAGISAKEIKDKGISPLQAAIAQTAITADQLSSAMMSNSVESSTLQGYLSNLEKSYANLNKTIMDAAGSVPQSFIDQAEAMLGLINKTKETIDVLRKLEQTEKDLKDIFGGSIQRASKLIASGEIATGRGVSAGGTVSTISEAQKTNQLEYLSSVRESESTIVDLQARQNKLYEDYNKLSDKDLLRKQEVANQYAQITAELNNARNANKALLSETVDFIKTIDQITRTEEKRTAELIFQYSILLDQNLLAEKQRKEERDQQKFRLDAEKQSIDNQTKIAGMEAGVKRLENAKLYLELSIQDNERTAQRLQLEEQLRAVRADSAKLAISSSYQKGNLALERELTLMQEFSGLGNPRAQEQKQYELQIRQKEEQISQTAIDMKTAAEKNTGAALIEKSNAYLKLQIAKDEKVLVDKRAAIEQERIRQDFAARYAEMEERKRQLGVTKTLAEQRATIDKKQINFDKDMQLKELDLIEDRYRQLDLQAGIFDKHVKDLGALFAREAGARAADLKNLKPDTEERTKFITDFENEFKKQFGLAKERAQITVPDQIRLQRGAVKVSALERSNEADRIATDAKALADQEIKAIEDRKTATKNLEKQQAALVELERRANELRADDAIKAAIAEEAAADLRYKIRQTELQNERDDLAQKQARQEAELKLLKDLKRLKGDTLFVALADSIDIFRTKTEDFITSMLTDVINGTKTAKQVFRDFMFSLVTEIQKAIVKKMISEPISNAIAGSFSGALMGSANAGGFFSSGAGFSGFLSSVGNFFSGNAATPTGIGVVAPGALGTGTAIGGYVKQMASGGYAGLRDRVPTLLEPGEFVIRRPAAMAIGGQALHQMNATGQTGPGNVMVNVNNQGTPQEVTGTPRVSMNGRDMIVDIVVKDIQNNGPIRKTLRGM